MYKFITFRASQALGAWGWGAGGPSLRASSLTLEAPGLHDTNLYGGGGM